MSSSEWLMDLLLFTACMKQMDALLETLHLRRNVDGRRDTAGEVVSRRLGGSILIVTATVYSLGTMYIMVIAKMMPETGYPAIDFFRTDQYYTYLIPLTVVPTFIAVYLNWVCIEFYKNN